jgi:hypothetical protein
MRRRSRHNALLVRVNSRGRCDIGSGTHASPWSLSQALIHPQTWSIYSGVVLVLEDGIAVEDILRNTAHEGSIRQGGSLVIRGVAELTRSM